MITNSIQTEKIMIFKETFKIEKSKIIEILKKEKNERN